MTLHLHDVSNFQGDYHPTGPTIAKATEGTDFTDIRFATTRQRTLAGGWSFLGYHFLRHGSIAAQVAHAASVIGKGQPLMLDVETAVDGSVATLADVTQFMDAYAQTGGKVTLVYLPQWYWSGKLGAPSLTPIAQRGAGLISSVYTTYSDTGPGWNPYGGMTPIIWQWTSTPLDTNAFKGTQDQMGQLFAHGPAGVQPAPPNGGDQDMYRYQFDTSWPDLPAALGSRYVKTDGLGMYVVEPFSTPQGGLPAATVLSKATTASGKWDWPTTFAAVTGGCAYAGWSGLATFRQPASAGGLTQAQVDARIAASTIAPPAQ